MIFLFSIPFSHKVIYYPTIIIINMINCYYYIMCFDLGIKIVGNNFYSTKNYYGRKHAIVSTLKWLFDMIFGKCHTIVCSVICFHSVSVPRAFFPSSSTTHRMEHNLLSLT